MGKTILVTGATDGIGRQTALDLARLGHHVIVHGRSAQKTEKVAAEVARAGRASAIVGDLSSLASVRDLAARAAAAHPRLDVLLCNAGVYMNERVITADGLETTFAVNHLAHFLLAHLLLPCLEAAATPSARARVVVVSSIAHSSARVPRDAIWKDQNLRGRFDGYAAYALSKLANVLFAMEMSRRAGARPIAFNALHPGVVTTNLLTAGFGMKGPDSLSEGAATSVHLATSPEVEGVTGQYFARSARARASSTALDPELARALYEESAALCGVAPLHA